MGFRSWVLSHTERAIIARLDRGADPGAVAALQRWLDEDLGRLQEVVLEYLQGRQWRDMEPLFNRMVAANLARAIPTQLVPAFVLVDVEAHPADGTIWEMSLLRSLGLRWDDAPVTCRVRNPLGYPGRAASDRSPFIEPGDIAGWLRRHGVLDSNVLLCGHNIRQHDIPLLAVHAPEVADLPLLDTLELSLLLRPQARHHALGGTHRAEADVLANLELLRWLDQELIAQDPQDLAVWAKLAAEDRGWQAYTSFVTRRTQPLPVPPDPTARFVQCQQRLVGTPTEEAEIPQWMSHDDAGAAYARAAAPILRGAAAKGESSVDLPEVLSPAALVTLVRELTMSPLPGQAGRVVVPANYVAALEEVHAWLGGLLLPSDARFAPVGRLLRVVVDGSGGPGALDAIGRILLFEWLCTTRDGRTDRMHLHLARRQGIPALLAAAPGYRDHEPEEMDRLFVDRARLQVEQAPWLVQDYAAWLADGTPGTAVLLKAHLLDDELAKAPMVSCRWDPWLDLLAQDPTLGPGLAALTAHLVRYVENRTLPFFADRQLYRRAALDEVGRRDESMAKAYACLTDLQAAVTQAVHLAPEVRRGILTVLLQAERLLTVQADQSGIIDMIGLERESADDPWRWRLWRQATEPRSLVAGVGAVFVTEGMLPLDDGQYAQLRLGIRPRAASVPLPALRPRLRINSHVIPPTRHALRPFALHAVARLTAELERLEGGASLHVLAGSRIRAQLLTRLGRAAGGAIHSASQFGSRVRTAERLSNSSAPLALVDSPRADRRLWSASRVAAAVLERIPFPARDDTLMQALERAETGLEDPFSSLYLPYTAILLREQVALLGGQGAPVELWDSRMARRPFYRSYFGRVLPGEELPLLGAEPLSPALEAAADAVLQQLGLEHEDDFRGLDLLPFLTRLTGSRRFREGQEQIIQHILAGQDALAILPTGAGKTACFLIPALVFGEAEDGLTVVISPLQSLMRDQWQKLRDRGLHGASFIDGTLTPAERARRLREIRGGYTWLLFLAPEQLRTRGISEALMERGVRLLVVDEAHCISQWGHDFRPDYALVPELVKQLKKNGHRPPIAAAFTATAPPVVKEDICSQLSITRAGVLEQPPVRGNLTFRVVPVGTSERTQGRSAWAAKMAEVRAVLERYPGGCGLIYVTTRREAEEVAAELARGPLPAGWTPDFIAHYHAGLPDRSAVEKRFLGGGHPPLRLLVATVALGMGVDKPDVDFVIHFSSPGSVENYYQEAGRAARGEGRKGECVLLWDPEDLTLHEYMGRGAGLGAPVAVFDELRRLAGARTYLNVDLSALARHLQLSDVDVRVALRELELAKLVRLGHYAVGKIAVRPSRARVPLSPLQKAIVERVPPEGDSVDPSVLAQTLMAERPDLGILDAEPVARELFGLSSPAVNALERLPTTHVRLLPDPIGAGRALSLHTARLFRLLDGLLGMPTLAAGRWTQLFDADLERLSAGVGVAWAEVVGLLEWLARLGLIAHVPGAFSHRVRLPRPDAAQGELEKMAGHWAELFGWLQSQADAEGIVKIDPARAPRGLGTAYDIRNHLSTLSAIGVCDLEADEVPGAIEVEILKPTENEPLAWLDRAAYGRRRRHQAMRLQSMREYGETCRTNTKAAAFLASYFEEGWLEENRAALDRLLAGLNPAQREAATVPAGHLLINAGAGTGKTQTIGTRVAYLQAAEGVQAERILAVTFSRVGRSQIADRVARIRDEVGGGVRPVLTLTLHGLALRILRMGAALPGFWLPQGFALVNQRRYKKQDGYTMAVNELFIEHYEELFEGVDDGFDRDTRLAHYPKALDDLRQGHPVFGVVLSASELPSRGVVGIRGPFGDEIKLEARWVRAVFERYEQLLRRRGRIDFAGMITESIGLLTDYPSLSKRLRSNLDYIIVDEYQDTSSAQEQLIRLIAGRSVYLNVVGDSDQTIFTFNGSDLTNILEFADRNRRAGGAETRIIALEENYRSTARILSLAAQVITKNRKRIPKTLHPAQAALPGKREAYRRANLPPTLVDASDLNAASVWVAAQVQRLLTNEGLKPEEITVLFRKDSPTFPQGETTATALQKLGIPINKLEATPPDQVQVLSAVQQLCRDLPDHSLVELTSMLETMRPPHAAMSISTEAVRAFLAEMEKVAVTSASELGAVLSSGDPRDVVPTRTGGVVLSSIHGVKGQEFRAVFLLYLADRHFPDFRAEKQDIEEERRLLYVALTRAEERLYVIGHPGARGTDFFQEILRADPKLVRVKVPPVAKAPEAGPTTTSREVAGKVEPNPGKIRVRKAQEQVEVLPTGAAAPLRDGWEAPSPVQQARNADLGLPSRAYAPWTEAEDAELSARYEQGSRIKELAQYFERQPGAIRSRLAKLGLE